MISHAILEIDTNIIRNNYLTLKKLCNSEAGAAVKANAYGLGATEISLVLKNAGCKNFFVATLGEGLDLRKVILVENIYVLNGINQGQEEYFVNHNLIPVANNLEQISLIKNYARIKGKKLPVVMHINSGMNRLGIPYYEVDKLVSDISYFDGLEILYLMSHLASSEEPDNEFNVMQLNNFIAQKNKISEAMGKTLKASLANSAGIFLGSDYHFDLVRPGCGIYGLRLNHKMQVLSNPIKLISSLIQVKHVASGESLGYNQTYRFNKEAVIGTIPVGYADGFPRSLSNNGMCYINNYKVPIIGRVSMDLINVDLSDLPEGLRQLGTEVEIFGPNQTPDDLAKFAGTIGDEIITRLGFRYTKKYI